MNKELNSGIVMEVKLVHPGARLPYRARSTDVGYDIYSVEDVDLVPGRPTLVRTGICISAPPGYYYTIEGRSSLWIKGIIPNRGIIDSTFCGEIIVSFMNFSEKLHKIEFGDRIVQIIIHRQNDVYFNEVSEFSPEYSQRGMAGFGSTGRK
jgi:dUTP pyrophosphatase